MNLYFDYNAAHPPIQNILEENLKLYFDNFGNPSGISDFSRKSLALIEKARRKTADCLGRFSNEPLSPDALSFTGSGTEAVYQMVKTFAQEGGICIASPFEHPAFYAACEDMKIEVNMLEADKSGLISADAVSNAFAKLRNENTVPLFVSVITVSNENGIIQDYRKISDVCRRSDVPFISDLIQTASKIPFSPEYFDAFTLNSVKFGGGSGASALYVKPPRRAASIFRGGSQESDRRAGTENLLSILNFADALLYQTDCMEEKNKRLTGYQNRIETMLKTVCKAEIVGENSPRSPNTTFAVLGECDMDLLIMLLDRNGITVSTGSSCKSKARKAPASLTAMGYSEKEALRAVRISTGIFTNDSEIEAFLNDFPECFKKAV